MRRKHLLVSVLTGLGLLVLSGCTGLVGPVGGGLERVPPDTSVPKAVDGRYIVVFDEGRIPAGVEAAIAALGGEVVQRFPEIGVLVIVSDEEDFALRLKEIQGVEEAGPDKLWMLPRPQAVKIFNPAEASASPGSGDLMYDVFQWDIKRVGGIPETWAIETGRNAVVAILDTGVNASHPDLTPNYLYGKSYVDIDVPLPPWITVPALEDGSPEDWHMHGTHVAGAIAAVMGGNLPDRYGGGVTGVAPEAGIANYKVLMLVEVQLPDGSFFTGIGFTSWIIAGLIEAVDDGVDVINMSLGGYDLLTDPDGLAAFIAYARATQYAWERGTLIVAAAGNAAWDSTNNPWKHAPSMTPAALAVVATGPFDELAVYSNYGAFNADVAAPGGNIPDQEYSGWEFDYLCLNTFSLENYRHYYYSQDIYGQPTPPDYPDRAHYVTAAGTSMAAPKVSGVAALIYSQNPGITPTEVVRILEATAEDLGAPGYDLTFGWGMVNALGAVTR